MAQIIDLTSRISNELPMVKITDELCVTVNNRKNTVLNVQAMVEEMQRKEKAAAKEAEAKGEEYEGTSELDLMNKALQMLIGEKNVAAVEELNLPIPEYKLVYETIMTVATGTYGEIPSK